MESFSSGRILVHPFFAGIYPVILIYSLNTAEVAWKDTFIPVLMILAVTAVLWTILALCFRSIPKAAIAVSVFWMLFFSHGYLYNWIHLWKIGDFEIGRHRFILIASMAVFAVITLALAKTRRNLDGATRFFNLFAVTLVGLAVFNAVFQNTYYQKSGKLDIRSEISGLKAPQNPPDIYHIVLDGYGRSDVLKKFYDFDNSAFLDFLKAKGFYVAEESRANYPKTFLSMSSCLNFRYMDTLMGEIHSGQPESQWRNAIYSSIKDNRAQQIFRALGYQFVTIYPGNEAVDMQNADIYKSPLVKVTGFHNALLNATPIPIFLYRLKAKSQYDYHRESLNYLFDHAADFAKEHDRDFPVYAYLHFLAPHPPFVFDEKGLAVPDDREFSFWDGAGFFQMNQTTREEYIRSYRKQIIYVTRQIQQVIEDILKHSKQPPVIYLQSDHGPGAYLYWNHPDSQSFEERMPNLNAYFFPDQDYRSLYPSISPVNTYRVILNQYFGGQYAILKDQSYFPSKEHPFLGEEVMARI